MLSIAYMLRASWIMATMPIVIVLLPVPIPAALREVLTGFSRRGKTVLQSSSNKFSVPQKYFSHFYILGVVWTTWLLVGSCVYASGAAPVVSTTGANKNGIWNSVFLLILMETQVLRRLFESFYVFKYSPSARMHIVAYLTGLFFYTAAPLSLCCDYALDVFNLVANGFIIKGKDVIQVEEFGSPLMYLRWYVWVGAAWFHWGWMHQRRCHAILGSLREKVDLDEHYAVPCGDWFNYVSSAHYLAEIVMYSGLVIASGFSDVTIWLLFGFVVANLGLAADETHRWYIRKFENYPTNRCTILPFVY